MTTPVLPYARILFVGPDLTDGSFAELFRQRLTELRGAAALADIVDTREGYAPLWQRVAEGERPLLVIDLEPQSSSPHLDWLRSQLGQQSNPEQLFVASAIGQAEGLPVDAACALIARPELHLPCVGVAAIAEHHAWSCIPEHRYRVLLCNGPRCTRRGALDLWKTLRLRLKAAGKLECDGGVHITRTQCQFPCDQGPTLSVYPPGAWYQVRSEADLQRIIDQQLLGHQPVPELLLRPADLAS